MLGNSGRRGVVSIFADATGGVGSFYLLQGGALFFQDVMTEKLGTT